MPKQCIEVLLLSDSEVAAISLRRFLEQRGCHCSVASPAVAGHILGHHAFDLILSLAPLTQNDPLIMMLTGSKCKVFYRFPVEDGCWWVPLDGANNKSVGGPAVHSREFAAILDGIVRQSSVSAGHQNGVMAQRQWPAS